MKTGKKLIACYLALVTAAILFGLWIFLEFDGGRQGLGIESAKLLSGQYEQGEKVRIWTSALPETFEEQK